MQLYKGQDLTNVDFAQDDNMSFILQMKKDFFKKEKDRVKGKDFISRFLHKIIKIPPIFWH